jgi:hypothetical protein
LIQELAENYRSRYVLLVDPLTEAAIGLLASARGKKFGTVLADPPWQFQNRTGKVAPEHKRLAR